MTTATAATSVAAVEATQALLFFADTVWSEGRQEVPRSPTPTPDSGSEADSAGPAALGYSSPGLSDVATFVGGSEFLDQLSRLSRAKRDRFTDLVMKGNLMEAKALLQRAPPVETPDKLLGRLSVLIRQRGCQIEVKVGSVAVKLHGLLAEDSPANLCAALRDNRSSCDAFVALCSLQTEQPTTFTETLTVMPARNDVALQAYPSIPLPSLDDTTHIALFDNGKPYAMAYGCKRFAKTVGRIVHFHRTEEWDISSSFLFLYADGQNPLNLVEAFARSKCSEANFDDALVWATAAVLRLRRHPLITEAFHATVDEDCQKHVLRPRHGRKMFVLLAWSEPLMEKARPLVGQLLKTSWEGQPGVREPRGSVCLPSVGPYWATTYWTYTKDVARRLFDQAIPHFGDIDSQSLRQVVLRHMRAALRDLQTDDALLSSKDVLTALHVRNERLLLLARDLDTHGDIGVSAAQLLYWQFLPPVKQLPLLGETIARRLSASEPAQTEASGSFTVHAAGASTIIKRFTDGQSRTAQMPDAFSALDPAGDDVLRLYHGTTIECATAIATDGIDADRFVELADFGAAFYTTTSFAYALNQAYRRYLHDRQSQAPAVLIYEVRLADLRRLRAVPTLVDDQAFWSAAVASHRCCRHQRWLGSISDPDAAAYETAQVLHGPICRNATAVEQRAAAQPSRFTQHAFRAARGTCHLNLVGNLAHVVRVNVGRKEWGADNHDLD